MAAYIRKGFPASRKPDHECNCHEGLVLKVCGKHSRLIFIYFLSIVTLMLTVKYLTAY